MRKNNPTDYDLVKQFIDGNHDSIDVLITRHRDRVYTYIYLIVKNHQLSEDLFQDTFIKVIRSLRMGKYQDNGKFLAWVLRIGHNLIIDHFRKEKQNNTFSKDDYELDIFNSSKYCEGNYEDELIRDQIHSDIRSLVDELPDDQKEVVILRHYKGLSFKEIADQTDVSINTALGRMRYALINMRKTIEDRKMSLTFQ
ncbi:sigma-70 family RNA polymerase sigma factor [Labilibaculum sp. DW002]|uniref:Sigma-70 family RNA polymerase sigma factor n=1 Tax=Paralabilibaculum antarcticum TaxID=2912572 RepID=A0ABT5VQR9_9BACT|nr:MULTISPECIES: sigma-70 family RNA polymerase sigma factor [unclassified Labilibaculum]MBI9057422.1 sigma-70 family RNA polymerase sigma factor [Labilibaculum sp.]MDE5417147.1 sigma-70 family RNA polymerase sigma factor [Labilibaculum sp. DW002]